MKYGCKAQGAWACSMARCWKFEPPMTRPIRAGSTSSRRASCQASASVAKATRAENDRPREPPDDSSPSVSPPISAPIKVLSSCRPGRRISENACLPASSASRKSALPVPIAEVTPRPLTMSDSASEALMQQLGQFADIVRALGLDQRQAQRQRTQGHGDDLDPIDRIGPQVHQAILPFELALFEPGNDLASMFDKQFEDFGLGHHLNPLAGSSGRCGDGSAA